MPKDLAEVGNARTLQERTGHCVERDVSTTITVILGRVAWPPGHATRRIGSGHAIGNACWVRSALHQLHPFTSRQDDGSNAGEVHEQPDEIGRDVGKSRPVPNEQRNRIDEAYAGQGRQSGR